MSEKIPKILSDSEIRDRADAITTENLKNITELIEWSTSIDEIIKGLSDREKISYIPHENDSGFIDGQYAADIIKKIVGENVDTAKKIEEIRKWIPNANGLVDAIERILKDAPTQ